MGLIQHIRLANPVVSILVPVYKVPEKYLRKCIESCISQTLPDIEMIVEDDGSPDNCGTLCEDYASRDYKIKVIHKENEGLSVARNKAFDLARGNYITFLDGDDYLKPNACEVAVNCAEEHDAQIVLFNDRNFFSGVTAPKKDCVAMRKVEVTLAVLHTRNNQKKTTGQEISPLGRCMQ
jgi:glycosyltransferase involved in cell wall biosynthesis